MYITGVKKTELLGHTANKKKREMIFIRNTEGKESFLKLGVTGLCQNIRQSNQRINKM
jgi:hypothetical protein